MAVVIHSQGEIDKISAAAEIAEEALRAAAEVLERTASVVATDRAAAEAIRSRGGTPAYAGYLGFPNRGGSSA